MQEAEKLYLVSDSKYLYIQRTDSGFDYTIYDKDSMKLLDGGVLDDPMIHISTACIQVCEQRSLDSYKVSIAPTELIETLAAASMPQELRDLTDSDINRLRRMTDAEYEALELFPDF